MGNACVERYIEPKSFRLRHKCVTITKPNSQHLTICFVLKLIFCRICVCRTIHNWQQKFRGQRWRRERMLRRATTSCPRDSIASEQSKSGTLVLRHPQATYLLHTEFELLWRIRRDASRLLRRAQTIATPYP